MNTENIQYRERKLKEDNLHNTNGKLTVVGAGPGDVDLITVKGIKVLAKADAVLYDALVNPELLDYCKQADLLYVGKRKGCYAFQQEEINDLIVQYGKSHGHIIRLKGGDPFIFGRGAEEMAHAAEFGMDVAMVPGLSSSVSVPALQNIPVTKRGSSESFWVITATTKEHKLSKDVFTAAKSNATVVILMGMHKLVKITEAFVNEGKSQMPIAIIQNGTRAEEKVAIAKIETIEAIVKEQGLGAPAIIVIGDVVNHRTELLEMKKIVDLGR